MLAGLVFLEKLSRLVKILECPAGQQFASFQRLLESAIAVGYVFPSCAKTQPF